MEAYLISDSFRIVVALILYFFSQQSKNKPPVFLHRPHQHIHLPQPQRKKSPGFQLLSHQIQAENPSVYLQSLTLWSLPVKRLKPILKRKVNISSFKL